MVRFRILLGVLALVICTGTAQANNSYLTTTLASGANLTCNTNSGAGGTAKVTIALTAGTISAHTAVTVGVTASGGGSLSSIGLAATPATTTALTSTTTSVVYNIVSLAGCAGAPTLTSSGTENYQPTLQFTSYVTSSGSGTVANDVTQAMSITVTAPSTSPLSVSPSSGVTISCTKNANGTYTGSSANFFVATSISTAGVPVTVDSTSLPTWISSVSLTNGGSNIANLGQSVEFTATVPGSSCSGNIGSSKSTNLRLQNLPALAVQTVPVTLMIVGPANLTLGTVTPSGSATSGSPMVIPYTKNQAATATGTVVVTCASSVYVTVDMTTVPSWLTVNFPSFQASTSNTTLIFTVTQVANSFTPGNQTATINLNVAGYASTQLYVELSVQNSAPSLTTQEGLARHLSWSLGQPLPTATITAISSGTPIPYNITIAGGNPDAGAVATPTAGLAFGSGTPISITFDSSKFAAAQPGTTLTSTVTINWTLGSTSETTAVVFTVGIQAPSTTAILSGISPTNLPSATAGETFTVTLYGSGFVPSTDNKQKTFVGIVNSTTGVFAADANVVSNVVSSSTIILTITVPAGTSDASLPFTTPGASVAFGVCNPNGVAPPCTATGGYQSITIDAGPIIQSVTSASSFAPVTQNTGTLAPYDIITIFGSNFCTSGGTGCTNTQVLYPAISASDVYGLSVTPDSGQRLLQVWIYPRGTTANGWAAPLLFATNSQINAVIPNEIVTSSATTYDIIVKFGTLSSTPYGFTSATTDPGVFVVDSNNNGAIVLDSGTNIGYVTNKNDATHAARLRNSAGASDWVSIYMTGLGTPASTALNSKTSGSQVAWTDCLSPASYSTYAGLGSTFPDGAVIQSSIITTGLLPPCFQVSGSPYVSVSVGSQATSLEYVGWAPDAIAGLYQVNVQLPASSNASLKDINGNSVGTLTAAVQVPVVVTVVTPNTHSQTVNMWVQPAMTLSAGSPPIGGIYPVSAGTNLSTLPYTLDTVTATQPNGSPAYALVGLTGPATTGVAVDPSGGVVTITSVLPAGTYSALISATDSGGTALPTEFITLTFTVGT